MINQLFTFPSTIARLRQGPSEHLTRTRPPSPNRAILITDRTADRRHRRFQPVDEAQHIAIEALDDHVVDRFLRWRRRQRRVGRGDPKALDRMLSMLRQKGIVKPCPPPVAERLFQDRRRVSLLFGTGARTVPFNGQELRAFHCSVPDGEISKQDSGSRLAARAWPTPSTASTSGRAMAESAASGRASASRS